MDTFLIGLIHFAHPYSQNLQPHAPTKTNKNTKSVININWYIVVGTEIYKEIDKCANLG